MEAAFRRAEFESGVISGIQAVTQQLIGHFPAVGADKNELPDKVVML